MKEEKTMTQLDKNWAIAMTEFLYLLKGFSNEEIQLIPKKLLDFFEEQSDKEYQCNFDYNNDFEEIDLRDETYGIISMICYNYWCKTQQEKDEYIKLLDQNERKYQELLNSLYNVENIFQKNDLDKDKNIICLEDNNNLPANYKENFITKLKKFVKKLFKKQ